ncbi:MAG TPA: 2-phosphosulfolactate phosphatase [Anaerolineales bacterium]
MPTANLDPFAQTPYRCRFDWGELAARQAAGRGDILVIVDVLRFSSAVVTAVQHGGVVYPCRTPAEAGRLAQESEAGELGITSGSLSPAAYLDARPGSRYALGSLNGAACTLAGRSASYLFAGGLLNAQALAQVIAGLLEASHLAVTVIACGERWRVERPGPQGDGLRPAVEDYLGAGAILSHLPGELSPEAQVCRSAFLAVHAELETILWECASGREIRLKGLPEDVRHAARLDSYQAVPVFREGRFAGWGVDP